MVERAMTNLTDSATPQAAWRTLVNSNDVVAIKVFSAPGPNSGTRPAVVEAVIHGLKSADVVPTNIVIWDQSIVDLRLAGYNALAKSVGISAQGARQAGYDPTDYYEYALISMLRFGDLEFGISGAGVGRRSYVTKLLNPRVTKIISIAPASNKHSTGVTGHLYSMTMGAVDNTWRFESNPSSLSTALPEIYAMPSIGDRVVLCITDALICQYEGEGTSLLHYSTVANELMFGTDPVALDVLALELLEKERESAQSLKLSPNLKTYKNAALLQLGMDDPTQVPIRRITVNHAGEHPAPQSAPPTLQP